MANRLAMNVEGMESHPEDSSKEDNTDVTTEQNIGVSGGNNVVLTREYGEWTESHMFSSNGKVVIIYGGITGIITL